MIDGEITFLFILLCGTFGLFGQLLRSVIGFYKIYMDKTKGTIKDEFHWKRFVVSLSIGALIGVMTSLIYRQPLSNTDILGIIAASYAGTDWLEGFLEKRSGEIK